MPVIALRGLVVFPGMSVQFDVGRKKSILAVNQAMDINQTVFLVAQKDLKPVTQSKNICTRLA